MKISIVTPSYNQDKFLEETIKSVLSQDHDNIEYLIIDGNSNDTSVDIIKKYESQIAYWESKPDKGQTEAINKGIKRATGDVIAYLCSDDTYEPGIFKFVVNTFKENPHIDLIYGGCYWIDEESKILRKKIPPKFNRKKLLKDNYIYQPSVFFKKRVFEKFGFFSEELHYGMDYEYWLRISNNCRFHFTDKILSNYRLHNHSKSVGQLKNMRKEMIRIKTPYGYKYHAIISYMYYFLIGIRYNQLKQYIFRFIRKLR